MQEFLHVTAEVMLAGETAFKLDPFTGVISGTPHLTLSATQGRAEVNITCQVALGGDLGTRAEQLIVLTQVHWHPPESLAAKLGFKYNDHDNCCFRTLPSKTSAISICLNLDSIT